MQPSATSHDSPPPPLTGDLEADTAAAVEWLYDHPELWLESDEVGPLVFGDDGRTAA